MTAGRLLAALLCVLALVATAGAAYATWLSPAGSVLAVPGAALLWFAAWSVYRDSER